jgi:hypothetical protein
MTADSDPQTMELLCYLDDGWQIDIRPANAKRPWMDDTNQAYAYRCLPLNIANGHGWEVAARIGFEVRWDGGAGLEALSFRLPEGASSHDAPVSIFGHGVMTFHINGLFRTPPGWNLWVGGPPNQAKDGIAPLTGIIETDWSPYSFTMNYRLTRPHHWVRFEQGETICFLFPVQRGVLNGVRPRLLPMSENPELQQQYREWSESRRGFNDDLKKPQSDAQLQKWQKRYFRGVDMREAEGTADHQSKLRVRPFLRSAALPAAAPLAAVPPEIPDETPADPPPATRADAVCPAQASIPRIARTAPGEAAETSARLALRSFVRGAKGDSVPVPTVPAQPHALHPSSPHHVVPDFFPLAAQMREGIDRHFSEPHRHQPAVHQIWNYWFVPDLYTYLRTQPEKLMERALVERFVNHLRAWAVENLGMTQVSWPYLSLYVDGCGQSLHNDSANGNFGYVFSLTNWTQRTFSGGETLVFREQDYWASGRFREPGAGSAFYETVPSLFNQLLLFDDRLIHGVATVRGALDPRQGRLVVHGHIEAKDAALSGALFGKVQNQPGVIRLSQDTGAVVKKYAGQFHGFATFAVFIQPDGRVREARLLVDRILSTLGPGHAGHIIEELRSILVTTRFPEADGESRLSIPFLFK